MYSGGKNGSGVFQQIINLIPKHDFYFELYAGSAGVFFNKLPSGISVLNDVDRKQFDKLVNLKIRSSIVLNLDAVTLLKFLVPFLEFLQLSAAKSFIYLDPPYPMDSRKSNRKIYNFEYSDQDHINLLSVIARCTVPIMISSYKNDMYDKALKGWNTHSFNAKTRVGVSVETVYFNYKKPTVLHDYRYIGNDFRERFELSVQRENFIKKFNSFSAVLQNSLLSDPLFNKKK